MGEHRLKLQPTAGTKKRNIATALRMPAAGKVAFTPHRLVIGLRDPFRECEPVAARCESQADVAAGRVAKELVEAHLKRPAKQ